MTVSTHPQNIHALFEQQAEKNPARCALIFENNSYTYGEINQKANQFAHFLLKKGLRPNSLVGLCLERSPDLIIALLGILKAGGAYVPLDPKQPRERLQMLLEDTQAPWLVTRTLGKVKFQHYRGDLIVLDQEQEIIQAFSKTNPSLALGPENLAYVIYTSGSTGKPKGVLIEHHSVVDYCQWFAEYSSCAYPQRIDFSQEFIFDMAVTTSLTPLALGLTQVICHDSIKHDAFDYLQYLQRNKINFIKITPSYFKILLHSVLDHPCALDHLQTIILGGENLTRSDCEKWLLIYPHHLLINEYGPTEATVAVTHFKISRYNVQTLPTYVPIGQAGRTMSCLILDAQRHIVKGSDTGELHLGGTCLARGYLNQAELSHEKFINNPFSQDSQARLYKTGDLACYLPNGDIQILGRIDEQVKIRGYRIEPAEIEVYLKSHPEIEDAVVTAVKQEVHQEQRLIAYYIAKKVDSDLNPGKLRHHLKQQLAEYMLPAAFIRLASFPINSNGKLDKKALPLPHFRSSSEKYLAPRKRIEKHLANIWAQELHLDQIGIKDNFFELGGNSLSAARIISKIKKEISMEVQLDNLYRSPTIYQLSKSIKPQGRAKPNSAFPNLSIDQNGHLLPLGEFQFMYWLASLVVPKTKRLNIVGRKRVAGKLDLKLLTQAFHSLFDKHEIMLHRPAKLIPAQYRDKKWDFKIIENSLLDLNPSETELVLQESMNQLTRYDNWKNTPPLILAKVFFLEDGSSELQVSIAHLIFDDVSREILFTDLSELYQIPQARNPSTSANTARFQDYVSQEWMQIDSKLDKDLPFWETYLKNTDLFVFPKTQVVKDMEKQGYAYSSYFELPEHWLDKLQNNCHEHRLSQADQLCALLGLALQEFQVQDKNVLINFVKSTREDESFDRSVGCFLRLDSIKLDLNKTQDLISMSKQVQAAVVDTAAHQTCPGGVKISCLEYQKTKANVLANTFFTAFFQIYAKLLKKLNLNYKILAIYPRSIFRRFKPGFIININVLSSFLSPNLNPEYFGFPQLKFPLYRHDLCNIDNVLEISFLKDPHQEKNYLVISGNLQPDCREKIGKKMIETLV